MKFETGIVAVVLGLSLTFTYLIARDKRPPETTEEVVQAVDELARFANLHPEIAFYSAHRDTADVPWEVDVYVDDGPKTHLTWSEIGFSHLLDAVGNVERDFVAFPRGYERHSSE